LLFRLELLKKENNLKIILTLLLMDKNCVYFVEHVRQTTDDERRMMDDGRRTTDDRRRMADRRNNGRQMADGGPADRWTDGPNLTKTNLDRQQLTEDGRQTTDQQT
jgi:hypothetical protein